MKLIKHAGAYALVALAELLTAIRQLDGVTEKKPGIFYRKSRAFLHFHEDPAGLFADVNPGTGWQRFVVNTPAERAALLTTLHTIVLPKKAP